MVNTVNTTQTITTTTQPERRGKGQRQSLSQQANNNFQQLLGTQQEKPEGETQARGRRGQGPALNQANNKNPMMQEALQDKFEAMRDNLLAKLETTNPELAAKLEAARAQLAEQTETTTTPEPAEQTASTETATTLEAAIATERPERSERPERPSHSPMPHLLSVIEEKLNQAEEIDLSDILDTAPTNILENPMKDSPSAGILNDFLNSPSIATLEAEEEIQLEAETMA